MSALKNFGITFLVAAIIFGVVAYFAVGFFSSTVSGILNEENKLEGLLTEAPDEGPDKDGEVEDDLPEIEGESFTALFVLTDKREELFEYLPKYEEDLDDPDDEEESETTAETEKTDGDKADKDKDKNDKDSEADKNTMGMLSAKYTTEKVKAAVIVRVSKETKEYNFIPVPTMSKVYTHGGAVPLESVLFRYGRDYFVQKVTSMTGIVPDYTFVVNITEMDDVMSAVGSFNCYIHEEIFSDGKNYFLEPEVTTAPETTAPETTGSSDKKDDKKDKNEATTEAVTEEIVIEKVVDAGNITVGPKNIEAILLFEDYSDGQTNRSTLVVDILKGIISRLAKMDEEALGKLYDELIGESVISAETTGPEDDESGDEKDDKEDKKDKEEKIIIITDMTKEDLLRKAELLSVFGEYENTFYEYPGTQKGNEFIPDIDKATLELIPLRIFPDPTKGQE